MVTKGKKSDGKGNGQSNSEFAGFVRPTKSGNGIRVNLRTEDLERVPTYDSKRGGEMMSLFINKHHLEEVMAGDREFCSISFFTN